MAKKLLLINPNSSQVVTDGIKASFEKYILPSSISVSLSYFTCPPSGPPSIDDHVTSVLSASLCFLELLHLLEEYDGFLVWYVRLILLVSAYRIRAGR